MEMERLAEKNNNLSLKPTIHFKHSYKNLNLKSDSDAKVQYTECYALFLHKCMCTLFNL